ncbi:phage protein [Morganella sp. B601]|uniref:phage protein n=1 Tax=Morganella sp. B601 TaxID=3444315 RepID=UPI003EB7C66A
MAVYRHDRSILMLNGYEITAFDESSDSLSIAPVGDDGAMTVGAAGRAVFVFTGNESGTLTIKLLQHSADNEFLSGLRNHILNSQSAPTPVEMYFKDTWNGDEIIGERGFFTTPPTQARGTGHNAQTWTLQFERVVTKLAKGAFN